MSFWSVALCPNYAESKCRYHEPEHHYLAARMPVGSPEGPDDPLSQLLGQNVLGFRHYFDLFHFRYVATGLDFRIMV